MNSILIKISDIKLNPNNPRLIKDDKFKKLVKSIQDFPEMLNIRPIVVNSDMVILGGNMRYKACKEAGLKEVPVIIADNLTEEQQKEFLIKDNVSGGEWDFEILTNEWEHELQDVGVRLINKTVNDIISGTVKRRQQDNRFSTFEPSLDIKDIFRPDALMLNEKN